MPTSARRLAPWLLALGLVAVTTDASAQDAGAPTPPAVRDADAGPPTDPEAQKTAIARALFDEGLALADGRRWADAADRFRRALEVRPSAPIRYNLGQTLARLGRLVEAVEMLRAVEQDATADPDVRASATQLRRRIDRRLARLTVTVPEAADDAEVTLDGLALPEAALGVRFPVDPGGHRVVLRQAGEEVDVEEVELREGQSAEVRLDARATAVAAGAGGALYEHAWFWAAVAVVVASGVVAAVIVATADDDASSTSGGLTVAF